MLVIKEKTIPAVTYENIATLNTAYVSASCNIFKNSKVRENIVVTGKKTYVGTSIPLSNRTFNITLEYKGNCNVELLAFALDGTKQVPIEEFMVFKDHPWCMDSSIHYKDGTLECSLEKCSQQIHTIDICLHVRRRKDSTPTLSDCIVTVGTAPIPLPTLTPFSKSMLLGTIKNKAFIIKEELLDKTLVGLCKLYGVEVE